MPVVFYLFVDLIGLVLFALAIYGKYGKNPAFHPWLDDSDITNPLLVAGLILMAISIKALLTIALKHKQQ